MKKARNDRDRRSNSGGRSSARQTDRKGDGRRGSGKSAEDRRDTKKSGSYGRSDERSNTRDDEKKDTRSRRSEETSDKRSYRRNEEGTERRGYGRRDEEVTRDSDKRFERDKKTGERTFNRSDKPFKAGTRPSGRRAREEGERRPRTATEAQRNEIRKDRSFDRQEHPYKEGTRPAPRKFARDDDERDNSSERKSSSSGRERSYSRTNDRDRGASRYGDKKNYREKSFDKSDGKTRLNKYIANSGICSRREADDLISAGVITVNDKIITELGYKISPGDKVKYNDRAVRSEKNVYVLLNKPKDYITTTDDPQNRRTVMNLIQGAGKERLYPVGRLDRATTGVLLFTNDGELTKKLTHPSHEIRKIYHVELDKPLKTSDMDVIKNGIELEDGLIKVDEVFYSGDSKKAVGVEIHSGKNRIVRRIFEALEYKVVKLDRVYFAGLTKKDLTRGRWRFLTEIEIANLKMLTAKKPKRSVN